MQIPAHKNIKQYTDDFSHDNIRKAHKTEAG